MWVVCVALLCPLALSGLVIGLLEQHLLALLDFRGRGHDLDLSPNELSATDVAFLISLFISRTVMIKLGAQSSLGAVLNKHQSIQADGTLKPGVLSSYRLSMPLRLTCRDLKKYLLAVKGMSISSIGNLQDKDLETRALNLLTSPPHVCLFLAAISQPAIPLLLARSDCPIQPLGAVNIRNRFDLLDYELAQQIFASLAQPGSTVFPVSIRARFLPKVRKVKRGIEADITLSLVIARQQDRTERITIFEQTFTLLEFVRWPRNVAASMVPTAQGGALEKLNNAVLNLPSATEPESRPGNQLLYHMLTKDPGKWAALCLDYNPIHHLTVAARLAGFPGRIAHGNHVAARAIEEIQNQGIHVMLPRGAIQQPFTMEVAFKRPVTVPSSLQIGLSTISEQPAQTKGVEDQLRVGIHKGRHTYVEVVLGASFR